MAESTKHSVLDTGVPVLVPSASELRMKVERFLSSAPSARNDKDDQGATSLVDRTRTDNATQTTDDLKTAPSAATASSPFMEGLIKSAVPTLDDRDGKTLTANGDVAHSSAGHALVDLFYGMDKGIESEKLERVLRAAWETDPEATLKIIWNARSIHLGKAEKEVFYRAVGWLYAQHPFTLLNNLQWLVRPVIAKKLPSKEQKQDEKDKQELVVVDAAEAQDDDFEMIDDDGESAGETPRKRVKLDQDAEESFEVKYGGAHGYWKDLLNIVALAVNDELKVDGDVAKVLNPPKPLERLEKKQRKVVNRAAALVRLRGTPETKASLPSKQQASERNWQKGGDRKAQREARHQNAIKKLGDDELYRALYFTIAELFAKQLKVDINRLESDDAKAMKLITLCGKWAPSHDGMHDKHTFIVSTIAEMLHDQKSVCPEVAANDRTLYLKHARQAYQAKTLSKLRKHLDVVERHITEKKYEDIKYDHVPSIAMQKYTTSVFIKNDPDRFEAYLEKVAEGKANISGATLLPSTMVHKVRSGPRAVSKATSIEAKVRQIEQKALDAQWNTLVQSVKRAGTLDSCIAICDVSGSMCTRIDKDGTECMDASIGLSLLIAEVTAPPFGGAFITFSNTPEVVRVGGESDNRTFAEKVRYIEASNWNMSTNFVAVFENLILKIAVERKLKKEEMVKRLFVFSDMQFNAAGGHSDRWTSSHERIKKLFEKEGYEMPELVFWNLNGGYDGTPVRATEEGCSLVSGYSQGMLRALLDGEEIEGEEEGKEEAVVGDVVKEKEKKDPLVTVMKVIGHDAYRMLKVVN